MSKEHAQSIFALAHTGVGSSPIHNHGRTLRLVVESNITASALSIRFANFYGEDTVHIGAATLALCDAAGVLRPNTLRPITIGGKLTFDIHFEKQTLSDYTPFAIQPGDFFALSIYYPIAQRIESGNWASNHTLRSRPGNFSADTSIHLPRLVSRFARTVVSSDITVSVTSVNEIIATCPTPGRVVACFGDSITQQGNWSVPFTKRLYRAYPGEISLCNLGISGNRLLASSPEHLGAPYGLAGVSRFARDVLSLQGLTHTIIALGTNDIGQPGTLGFSENEKVPPLSEYIAGMEELARQLRQRGVKIYAATLAPRGLIKPFDEEREALRQKMNDWIRTSPVFDAVLDFDEVLKRDDGLAGMKDGCALPDQLHPSPYGGLWMAKSINLSLFGGDKNARG